MNLSAIKIPQTTFLFTFFLILSSCNRLNTSTEVVSEESKSKDVVEIRDELYREVIETHDIAMLKMQKIMNLKAMTIKEADSLRKQQNESFIDRIVQLEKSQLTLEEANKSMMIWMREFRPPSDTVSNDEAIKYLKSEQDKISQVNANMDQAIEVATTFFN